jgi:hypothetical protein
MMPSDSEATADSAVSGWLLELAERFQRAWQRQPAPKIEEYLPAEPGKRLLTFRQLAPLDLENRLKAGQSTRVEAYVQGFPELTGEAEILIELCAAEYTTRSRGESGLQLTEYRQRFPALFPALERRLDALRRKQTLTTPIPIHEDRTAAPCPASGDFSPADYDLLGEFGRGGMGVVYRARDRRHGTQVALKTLQTLNATSLYRFKQEFRALAGIVHRNLVLLHELVCEEPHWFFTMEAIEGVDFLSYVRAVPAGPERLARLRAVLGQLTEGLATLHQAGKLHRDIKPSNVLVTPLGRVVLVDFGIAVELDATGLHETAENHTLGTVPYMSPEQAAARPVSTASDWYSVGVVLYEALTGRRPFEGTLLAQLRAKEARDPLPPTRWVPDLPSDLADLSLALLRRNPAVRASEVEIERCLGKGAPEARPDVVQAPLVGRQVELQALHQAFADLKKRQAVTVAISGQSGLGKTALVQHFLRELAEQETVVILAGRCYEKESVPYKALDSAIDALSRYLARLADLEVQALLPREVSALARVFPVLGRVRAIARFAARTLEYPDPREARRRAAVALRELLSRVADRVPVVLFLDDLHWGDADSAALLADLVRPPDPPALLLIGGYRSEDEACSSFLQALWRERQQAAAALDFRVLALGPLSEAEARTLADALLRGQGAAQAEPAAAVARESGGNPFFVTELIQHLRMGLDRTTGCEGRLRLEEVLWQRVLHLPASPRRLLELVAVAGRPLRRADACQAAGLSADALEALALLESTRLLRGTAPRDEVETYHDRVRECVVASLAPAARQEHHQRLVTTFAGREQTDQEFLAIHCEGAGELARAGMHYARAAARASRGLAFDHAARLYRRALELCAEEGGRRRDLQIQLGDALVNAGRGAEAAQEFLQAADTADTGEAVELRRRAAEQLLRSGHIDSGIEVLQGVLAAVGLRLPPTPRRALLSLLWRRALLRLRGLHFRERRADEVAPSLLRRIDVCWSAALGLSLVDPLRGADFQARHLLLSLKAGEPNRIAFGLALEAGHCGTTGGRTQKRGLECITRAGTLAKRLNNHHAEAFSVLGGSSRAWLMGRWQEARDLGERSEASLREHCSGVAWELATAQFFTLSALAWLGEWNELSLRLPKLVKEAREKGDLYAATSLPMLTYAYMLDLLADDAAGARERLRRALADWSPEGFHLQHFWALYGAIDTALYAAGGREAQELVRQGWPRLQRSRMLRVQVSRLFWFYARGRVALRAALEEAVAGDADAAAALRRSAARDARAILREDMPWATPLGLLLQASDAAAGNDAARAIRSLSMAEEGFVAAGMALFAAAARSYRGRLLGGEEGGVLRENAAAYLASQKIRNSERLITLLVPGFSVG